MSTPSSYKRIIYPVILALLLAVIIIHNIYWLGMDKTPVFADEVDHLNFSQEYYFDLKDGNITGFFLEPASYYPPLLYYITSVAYLFFGPGYYPAVFSQFLFHIILVFFVFLTAKHLWDEDTGLLAAIMSITFPLMQLLGRRYFQDVSLAAMVAVAVYCLYRSKEFTNKKFTWLFFIACGIGMLAKLNFVFFIFMPFLAYFFFFFRRAYRENRDRPFLYAATAALPILVFIGFKIIGAFKIDDLTGTQLLKPYLVSLIPAALYLAVVSLVPVKDEKTRTLYQGAAVCFIIVWYFYFLHWDGIQELAKGQRAVGNNTKNFLDYCALFIQGFHGIPWVVFSIIGLGYYIFSRNKNTDRSILAANILVILVIHYILPMKENRYFAPIVVFTCPFMGLWISRIRLKPLRYSAAALMLAFAAFSMFGWYFYNPGKDNPDYNIRWNHPHFQLVSLAPYPKDHWKLEEMTDTVESLWDGKNALFLYVSPTGMKENLPFRIYPVRLQQKHNRKIYFVENLRGKIFNYPDSKINLYSFLFASRPEKQGDGQFDKLIILNIHPLGEMGELPAPLVERLREARITGEPQPVKDIFPDAPIEAEIMEIPLNPPIKQAEMEYQDQPLVRVSEIQRIWGKGSFY